MTDKQIIIDGVNVRGCGYFLSSNKYCGQALTGCQKRCDCTYKQLARKTQEYEALKEDYKELEHRHNEAYQNFELLKQENEKLKEKYQEYVKTHHYNNAEFQQERNSLIQEMGYKNRYRKALEEIEKILTNTYCLTNFTCKETAEMAKKILNLINEVKEE